MLYKFFKIPLIDSSEGEEKLNDFIKNHKVIEIEKNFCQNASSPCWAMCLGYIENVPTSTSFSFDRKKPKVDYREILDEDTFEKFVILREIRKAIATEDTVPPYAVFTNEELAQIAALDEITKSELLKIPGIGEKKVEKYLNRIIDKNSQIIDSNNLSDGQ